MRRRRIPEGALKVFRGVEIRVFDDGRFTARVGTDHLQAETLKDLEAQIEKAVRKTKIKIVVPFTVLGRVWKLSQYGRGSWVSGYGVRHMEMVGERIDGGFMVRGTDGDPEPGTHRQDRFERGGVVRRMTDEEVARWVELRRAKEAADKAYREYLDQFAIDLQAEVRRAKGEQVEDARSYVEDVDPIEDDLDPRSVVE